MSSAEQSAVEVADVTHRYGAIAALSGVSLSLQAGSSTALVGPDGVGKSTLLGSSRASGGCKRERSARSAAMSPRARSATA